MRRRIWLGLILLLLAGAYSYGWFWCADLIRREVRNALEEAAGSGIVVTGDFPTVSGFPGFHHVHFSGTVTDGATLLSLPRLEASGIFLPGFTITIQLPEGATLTGTDIDPKLWSVDRARLSGPIPKSLPASLDAPDMAAWQAAGGVLSVDDLQFAKGPLRITAKGAISLDAGLQPTGNLSAAIAGHMGFLGWLQQEHYIKREQALVAVMVLNGLSRPDPKIQEPVMQAELALKDGVLSAGPIRLAQLPPIVWAARNPPVSPR